MGYGARFEGKRVIITGAATGIGRATAARMVAEGANVLGFDLNEEGLKESVANANAGAGAGGKARYALGSVSNEADLKRAYGEFAASEGGIDVLVNMAGILRATHTTETSLEQFMQVININLVGVFLSCREALPHLVKTKGNIVNAASTSSFFGHPYMAAYASSKGGVMAMTRTLAWEFMNKGVRVNAVAPGGISTPMVAGMAQGGFPPEPDMTLVDECDISAIAPPPITIARAL